MSCGKRHRAVNSTFSDRGQWSNLIIRRHATIQLKTRAESKPLLALDLQATVCHYRSGLKRTINRIYEPQGFFVGQKRLLHLIHYVSERNPVFRIGKGVCTARTGMSESVR